MTRRARTTVLVAAIGLMLLICAGAQGQGTHIVAAANAYLALRSNWPEVWNALGLMNFQLRRYDDDVKAFSHAADQAPIRPNYWNSLAAAYSFAGRSSMAVKALEDEQGATAGSATFTDWNNLGNGFLTMQEFEAAANAIRQTLKLNPNYGPVWNNLGTLEGVLGNTQAAFNDYRRAGALGEQTGANNAAGSSSRSRRPRCSRETIR